MVTREEYIKALDIVEEYQNQIFKIDKYRELSREKISEWMVLNKDNISNRLTLSLQRLIGWSDPKITYIDEITKRNFLKIRYNGVSTWNELNAILNKQN